MFNDFLRNKTLKNNVLVQTSSISFQLLQAPDSWSKYTTVRGVNKKVLAFPQKVASKNAIKSFTAALNRVPPPQKKNLVYSHLYWKHLFAIKDKNVQALKCLLVKLWHWDAFFTSADIEYFQNGATCVPMATSFLCNCQPGYTGKGSFINYVEVHMCFIFYSMQRIFALPGWRHGFIRKTKRVSHFGLVF